MHQSAPEAFLARIVATTASGASDNRVIGPSSAGRGRGSKVARGSMEVSQRHFVRLTKVQITFSRNERTSARP